LRINRVHLENYRIHESLDIEFSKGINLLLGDNGKGKSSILEAIGYALFDSDLRTNNQREAIKYGKKSAKIEIEFVGIDDEEYRVVRKIPGTTQLFKGDEMIEGKNEKIRELCGIKGDMKGIYDNVIVAKQNEFISAFKEKATEREKIFNKVFNTDIYAKIYEGYSREVASKYERDLDMATNSFQNISEMMIDSKELEEKIEFQCENLKVQKEYEGVLETKYSELKDNLRDMRALEINIEKLSGEKRVVEQSIANRESEEKEITALIDESIQALKVAQENQKSFEEYQDLAIQLEKIKKEKRELEAERDRYYNFERKKSSVENELSQLIGEIEVQKNIGENYKKNLSEKSENLKELNLEKERKEREISLYRDKIDKIKPILEYSLDIEDKLEKALQTLEGQRLKIQERESEIKKYSAEVESLEREDFKSKLLKLEGLEKEVKELEGRNRILESQAQENREAFSMLKSAICPYLKESCENLKGRDVGEFFNEKLERIEKERESNRQKVEKLHGELEIKDKIQNGLYRYEELKKEIAQRKNELEKESLKLENWEMKYQLKENEYSQYREKNGFSKSDELQNLKLSYEISLNNLDLNRDLQETKKLEGEIVNLRNEIEKSISKIEELNLKREELRSSLQEIEKFLEENREVIENFKKVSALLDNREQELKLLEPAKELYIENYKKSMEREKHSLNLKRVEEILKLERENLQALEKNLQEELERLSKYDKELLQKREEELNEELKISREKIGNINSDITYLKEKLQEALKKEERLKEEKARIERLKLKIQLTKSFREKIKNMGKEVSKNMLKEIEILATENFRKITGRGEKIIWSNEDKDRYSIYLFGDRGELKFEQLSGGEQVAVAISIRGAMSEIFTDSKFSIFDEPTNNLDSERRRSLADSIGEILKNLEQSIIVTHDDTFREMAQRVIEL
jgi:exonuclease SbcC